MNYFKVCNQKDFDQKVTEIDRWSQPFNLIAPDRKLSFFCPKKEVYAIPRIPCELKSPQETALTLVKKESIEL